MNFLAVGIGGALGAICRYGMTLMLCGQPLAATLLSNIFGSLIIGWAIGSTRGTWQLFVSVGFCGGFTTFSTFSNQTLGLLQSGQWLGALIYAVGSVVLCIVATLLGFALSRWSR